LCAYQKMTDDNKQKVLNFTPHDVHVHIDGDTIQTYLAPQKPYKEIRLDADDQKLVLRLENGVKVVEKPVYTKLVNFPFEVPPSWRTRLG